MPKSNSKPVGTIQELKLADHRVLTGDRQEDAANGRAYADQIVKFMQTSDNPTILGHIVREMIETGEYGAFEIAFSQRIAESVLY